MTRRTSFNGSASGRRRERRAALQNEVTASSEALHRPTESRVQLQCKRKPSMRSEVVTITTMVSQYSGSTCLPDVALYSAGHRSRKSVTAR
ncbi:TPA: antitermination protein N [Citrobacter freundii]|nr:antitermination protein N [Citrobacter freundii]HAT2229577.1 antitermination protein N [Citrobacter freundii]HAT2570271.1 antitermination protein N [Citrobacter freundii]HAT2590483.1 antitermination protein N [Citrobacter freundii]HAT3025767.1 antitermination protein N [Citrobacter freundii]